MKKGVASFNDMFRRRLVVVFVAFLVAVLGIESRFVYLQVIARADLVDLANQQLDTDSIPIKAKRGMILDSTGRVLAEDIATWSLGLYMKEVKDAHLTATSVAPIINVSAAQLEKQIRSASSTFIYLKKQVGETEYSQLSRLNVPGIVLDKGYRRVYPLGSLTSSVVGVTGSDNQGLSGIEFQYDKELRGTDGKQTYRVSGSNPGEPPIMEDVEDPIPGKNLVLTIDSNIQYFAQQALMETLKTYAGKRATCTILDPKTDAVLAMVDVPSVDPAHWQDAGMSSLSEKVVSANYEPGSVFKAATSVAGLETGTIDLQSTFYSGGTLKVYGTVIHEVNDYAYGNMNLYAMLQHSSNVGFAQLSMKIGAKPFYDCLTRYGFGKRTGIDLPGEESGILLPPSLWSKTTLPTMGFGQGVAVTAIQMANFYATIANGGLMQRPYIVDRIVDASGTSQKTDTPGVIGQVFKPETAKQVLEGLHGVVQKDIGVFSAYIPGYQVAGKTGTAQVAAPGGGYLSNGTYVYSFAGILTANDPRVVVFLSIHETTKGARTSFQVAGPTFKKIALNLIQYLRLKP
ncbi:MAG: penicillin-binding protein 2 [Candidatus Cryosericum sp.]|nr:penicillin-binding protein 2 [bacterium]